MISRGFYSCNYSLLQGKSQNSSVTLVKSKNKISLKLETRKTPNSQKRVEKHYNYRIKIIVVSV